MFYPSVLNDNFYDDLFDGFFKPEKPHRCGRPAKPLTPGIVTDVKEFDDKYELHMEIPGYSKDDIKAELKDGYIIVSAEKDESKEEKDDGGKFIRKERYVGKVSRSFYIGKEVKTEDIGAKFEDGILKLTIPKIEPEIEKEEDKLITIA